MLSILCFTWKFCQKYGNSQGKAWQFWKAYIACIPKAYFGFPSHVLGSQVAQGFVPGSSVYRPKIPPRKPLQFRTKNLILHHEGKKYLKFRPTSQTIIAILLGHSPKKNASLSNHELLTQLKKAGNTEMNKFQTETPQDDDGLPEPAK